MHDDLSMKLACPITATDVMRFVEVVYTPQLLQDKVRLGVSSSAEYRDGRYYRKMVALAHHYDCRGLKGMIDYDMSTAYLEWRRTRVDRPAWMLDSGVRFWSLHHPLCWDYGDSNLTEGGSLPAFLFIYNVGWIAARIAGVCGPSSTPPAHESVRRIYGAETRAMSRRR